MSERKWVCRPCLLATGQLVAIVARPFPEGGGGQWVCEGSPAHECGVYSDVGTLDLGIFREEP
jgi:hypothetical protein